MNSTELELIGLHAAVAAVIGCLKRKGVVTAGEIDRALGEVEAQAISTGTSHPRLSSDSIETMCFPVRYLRAANAVGDGAAPLPSFEVMASAGRSDRSV